MEAWYGQRRFYNFKTGTPTAGMEQQVWNFVNLVNAKTTKFAFAVKENIVMARFCPRAETNQAALLKNVNEERVAPRPPRASSLEIKLSNGAPCQVLEGQGGKRPPCGDSLCCGRATKKDDDRIRLDLCKESAKTEYTEYGESYSFECYDSGTRLVLPLIAVAVSTALIF